MPGLRNSIYKKGRGNAITLCGYARRIAAIAVLLCSFTSFLFAEVVDKILVIVDDEIVTQSEVDRILLPVYNHYKNMYSGEELVERLSFARRNVLHRLINDKLLLSEAKRKKIEVGEREVEEKINEVRGRFSTEEEFEKALAQENLLLSEMEEKFKEQIMIDRLIDVEVRSKVTLSPNDLVVYYDNHKDEFREPTQIKLRSILIRISDQRPEEEALKAAKAILSRLQEGGDFALLAKEYSEGPYAESGGDMGWVKEGELMERINNLIFTLDKNEISGILRTNLGFHIFKVEDKIPSKMREFPEVREEVEERVYKKKVDEKVRILLEDLKQNAYIAFR